MLAKRVRKSALQHRGARERCCQTVSWQHRWEVFRESTSRKDGFLHCRWFPND